MRAGVVACLCALVTVLGCSDFKSVTDAGADANDAEVATEDRAPADASDVVDVVKPTDVADAADATDAADVAKAADVMVVEDIAPALDGATDATPDATEASVDVAGEDADACGLTVCGGACVNTATDTRHCGACAAACPSIANGAATCRGGTCGLRCDAGFADCDGAPNNGCEVDLNISADHCGRCGNACSITERCDTASCTRRQPGWSSGASLPEARANMACASDGERLMFFGGSAAGTVFGDGRIYDPRRDRWITMSSTGSPSPSTSAGVTWTDRALFVWGGLSSGSSYLDDGALYDPASERWHTLPSSGLTARAETVTVSTGNAVVVWGGTVSGPSVTATGASFSSTTERWTPMSQTGAPTARANATGVWTGREVIVWGGHDASRRAVASGSRYNPSADTWTTVSATNAPAPRFAHTAVWTGREMIVWGGGDSETAVSATGGVYDPFTDAWRAVNPEGSPAARIRHTAVWTGREMVIFGGFGAGGTPLNDGGAYDPVAARWRPLPMMGAPPAGGYACAAWSGGDVVVVGGRAARDTSSGDARAVGRYLPPPRYASPASPRASDVGLVAHYEFEGNLADSGGAFGDGMGRGTLRYAAGRFDRALEFNGTDTLVRLPDAPNGRELTVSVQARIDDTSRGAFLVNGWDVTREHFELSTTTTAGSAFFDGGSHALIGSVLYAEVHLSDPMAVPVGRWQHVALTLNASVVILYVQGREVARIAQRDPTGTGAGPQPVGIELGGSSRNGLYLRGALDDLRIYNRVLTATEIRELSGVTQPSCPDPSEPGCGTVAVTGGTFTFGQDGAWGTRMPVPGVSVSDFALDVAEVTVARFRRFWNAGHPGVAGGRVLYPEGVSVPWSGPVTEPERTANPRVECNWSPSPGMRDRHPINCIDWYTAQAFCVWDGGRLPTEAEFEYAARTSVGFTYPWSEALPDATLVCASSPVTRSMTCEVASFPATRGFYDLTGNVWERVADNDDPERMNCWIPPFRMRNPLCLVPMSSAGSSLRTTRGGAYDSTNSAMLRGAARSSDSVTGTDRNAGMRCARSR